MSATYGSSRTNNSRALSTYADPFQPRKEYIAVAVPTYTRPADWVSMPAIVSGDKTIAILCAVWNDASNFMALSVSGSAGYTVDWGDGSSPVNVASGVQANYNYDYATVSSSVTTRGYKTVLITITPQSSGTLTALNLNLRNPTNTNTGTGAGAASSPVLEIVASSSALTSVTMGSGTPNVRMGYCEQVTFIDTGTITSMASLFNNFHVLQNVIVDPAFGTSTTDMSSMFGNCYKLPAAPVMTTASVTNMNNMFQSCNSLVYVPDYNTSAVTQMGSMFSECRSLRNAPNLNTAACTNFGSMYANCSSLVNVPLIKAAASGLTTLAQMFQGSGAIRSVAIEHSSSASNVAANSMFQNCYSLVNLPKLDYSKFNNTASMYSACYSMIRLPQRVLNLSNSGNSSQMFNNCYSLQYVDSLLVNANVGPTLFQNCASLVGINSITGSMTLTTTFNGCISLKYLPTITCAGSGGSGFATCQSLTSVTIDYTGGNVMNGPTNMFSGCISLKTVNLINPIITNSASGMFQDCRSLEEAPTLPSMSTVTNTSSMFNGCYSLRTAPAMTLTSCTNTSSMFNNCFSLQTVPAYTLHPTAATTVSSMFFNCYSLENVDTLTIGSGTLTMATPFSNCSNLSSLRSVRFKISFSIASAKFAGAQLDQVYTDLPTATATITVTSNWGTATDTPSIATGKGWTVTGS